MKAEELIKYKKFIELTPLEKEQINDLATNEKEFDEVKSFLLSTETYFSDNKMKASDNLRQNIMSELHAPITERKGWLISFFYFLFPSDKSWFQVPAIQFGSLAILLIGFFFMIKTPLTEQNLAHNPQEIKKTEEKTEQNFVNENKIVENLVNKPESNTIDKLAPVELPTEIEAPIPSLIEENEDILRDVQEYDIEESIEEDAPDLTLDFDYSNMSKTDASNTYYSSPATSPILVPTEADKETNTLDEIATSSDTGKTRERNKKRTSSLALSDDVTKLSSSEIIKNEQSLEKSKDQVEEELIQIATTSKESKKYLRFKSEAIPASISIDQSKELLDLFYEVK